MKRKNQHLALAACSFEVLGQMGKRIQLLPYGEFRAIDGRPTDAPAWFLTEENGHDVAALANQARTQLVVDYVWKSTALFTLFGFWMQTSLAGFAGCQECRKARRSRMVLDNLRKLLNHHAAKKRKLGSLKKCK